MTPQTPRSLPTTPIGHETEIAGELKQEGDTRARTGPMMNPSLRRLVLIVAIVCGILDSLWLAWAATTEAPKRPAQAVTSKASPPQPPPLSTSTDLEADPSTHDFGTVLQGRKVEHTFTLRNKGNKPVRIREVSSSCGCAAAMLSTRDVVPGKTTQLKVTFAAGGARGRFNKAVRVVCAGPSPPLILRVSGRVAPLVRAEPDLVLFGRVAPGQTRSRTVRLVVAHPDVHFTPGPPVTKGLAVRLESLRAAVEPAGTWNVTLMACPQDPADSLEGTVMVPTGNAEAPYVLIRVTGDVEASH